MSARKNTSHPLFTHPLKSWTVLSSRLALDSKWFRVRKECVQLPNGHVVDEYFLWEKGDAALVVPVTREGGFVVTRQYKHGVDGMVVEFPGGGLDPDEEPRAAARREVLEETGFCVSELVHLATLSNDPTKECGLLHVYLGTDAVKTHSATPEVTEDVETRVVSAQELRKLVAEGYMYTSSSVAAALIALHEVAGSEPDSFVQTYGP